MFRLARTPFTSPVTRQPAFRFTSFDPLTEVTPWRSAFRRSCYLGLWRSPAATWPTSEASEAGTGLLTICSEHVNKNDRINDRYRVICLSKAYIMFIILSIQAMLQTMVNSSYSIEVFGIVMCSLWPYCSSYKLCDLLTSLPFNGSHHCPLEIAQVIN